MTVSSTRDSSTIRRTGGDMPHQQPVVLGVFTDGTVDAL